MLSSAPCTVAANVAAGEEEKMTPVQCFGSPARGPIKRDVPTKTPSKEARHGKQKPIKAAGPPLTPVFAMASTPLRRPSREEVEVENEKLLLAPHKPMATRDPYTCISGAQPKAFRRLDFNDDDE